MPAVTLHALRLDDADTIAAWGDDPEFCSAAGWSASNTRDHRAARLRSLISEAPHDLIRLGVRSDEGLVGFRREGQSLFYSIADPRCEALLATLHRLYCPED